MVPGFVFNCSLVKTTLSTMSIVMFISRLNDGESSVMERAINRLISF